MTGVSYSSLSVKASFVKSFASWESEGSKTGTCAALATHLVSCSFWELYNPGSSAATSTEEIGNPVYPPARRKLAEHGISCAGKTARQLTKADYTRNDLLIGMDRANIRNMNRICGGDPDGKIKLLLSYTDHSGDVADPWYTGDFDATWRDVMEGCQGLLKSCASG